MRRKGASAHRALPLAAVLALSVPAMAQDDDPSLDFLEYLGSWDEEDETWYVDVQIAEPENDASPEEGEQSPREARVERNND